MKRKINIFFGFISFVFFMMSFVAYWKTSKVDFLIYALLFNMHRAECSRLIREE